MKRKFEHNESIIKSHLYLKDLSKNLNRLVILSSPFLAEQIFENAKKEIGQRSVYFLPHSETLPYDFFSSSNEIKNERIRTLSKINYQNSLILVCSIQALMSPCSDKNHLLPINVLKVKDRLYRNKFLSSLNESGYKKKELVTEVGEFATRGLVIDIFPSGSKYPVRIELDNEKIQSLRLFNPNNQLTTKKIESFLTLPPQEYPLDQKSIERFKKNWRNTFDVDEEESEIFEDISKGKKHEGAEMYLPLFFNKKITPIDYLNNLDQVYIDSNVFKVCKDYQDLIYQRYEEYRYDIQRPLLNPSKLFLTKNEFNEFTEKNNIKALDLINFNKTAKKPTKQLVKKKENLSLRSMPTLGDLVVHLYHGIGIFRGLKQITTEGIINDCLEIEYWEESKIFVPVESMHLVSKYYGSKGVNLDRLGSKKWETKKRIALKKTFDTALELLNLQARRNSRKGIEFHIPKKDYKEFTDQFPYIETSDQLKTISEIEKDLQKIRPMDRLVCGEVGFGKTEVAMRASFLTSFNNSQTCILVPTTLLAQQHFESFIKRFNKTAIRIEKISRDVSIKQKKIILEELKQGAIDIIIGTHALLQKDIGFKSLGLLIIDEEHRFGVRQKEKIKVLRENVNVLHLSATPIPRSLHFALSELKDFSIIATPPSNRLSVKTFVHSFSENLVKECIQRELLRDGQIYYLCNDLRLIESRKQRIEGLFPKKRIEIVHGQLKTNEIERVMVDFQDRKIDVLVCSTIIESGLDISNANTLIVEEAERLGLAQMHQLRGRVGRGNKQAYAYFLKSKKILRGKNSDSRLQALKDSNSLSAGFLLAIKDLEIRGTGEILGENQSGIMETIGIDLYLKLLKKVTKQIQKGNLDLDFITKPIEVNLGASSLIPMNYLPDINQRLEVYNRIATSNSLSELHKLQVEVINRFGPLPVELKTLFYETEISLVGSQLNIKEISITAENILIKYKNSKEDKKFMKGKELPESIKIIYKELDSLEKISI